MRPLLLGFVAVLTLSTRAGASDSVSPAPITDFKLKVVQTDSTSAKILLTWTAAGDDGRSGKAWRYDMRIACGDLDDRAWSYAASLTGDVDLSPQPAGSSESLALELANLEPQTDYSVRAKAVDKAGNFSPLSNPVTFHTRGHSRDFSETIYLNGLELWAWGHRVTTESVVAKCSGCEFSLGEFVHPSQPIQQSTRVRSDESWEKFRRKIPRIQEFLDQGVCLSEATIAYYAETERLYKAATALWDADGASAAISMFNQSSLVDTAWAEGNTLHVQLAGKDFPEEVIHSCGMRTPSHDKHPKARKEPTDSGAFLHVSPAWKVLGSRSARKIIDDISSHTRFAGTRQTIMFITQGGSMESISGGEGPADARAQIKWLLESLTTQGMPDGPLHDPIISEILEANR